MTDEAAKFPKFSDAVYDLMNCDDEVVPAAAIAPILKMHPETIVYKAKNGTWDRNVCNYIVSGRCVKFFRIDFLRKGGWIH